MASVAAVVAVAVIVMVGDVVVVVAAANGMMGRVKPLLRVEGQSSPVAVNLLQQLSITNPLLAFNYLKPSERQIAFGFLARGSLRVSYDSQTLVIPHSAQPKTFLIIGR